MQVSSTPPASLSPAPGIITEPFSCSKCGYALRGLDASGVCPECGQPIVDSLKGFFLQYSSPEYVEKLRSGASLVLNGILLQIILGVLGIGAGIAIAAGGAGGVGAATSGLQAILTVLGVGVSVIIFLGYFKLTEPDPKFTGTDSPDKPRQWVRIAAITSIVIGVIQAAGQGIVSLGGGMNPVVGLVVVAMGFVAFAAWAVQFFAMMLYMKWLGSRVPDHFFAVRTKMYMWLLPVLSIIGAFCMMIGPLIALVLYWNMLDRFRKHLKSIQVTGVPAVLKGMYPPA